MNLTELLHAAEDTPDPRDYVSRVKAVVAQELQRLDATVKIKDTLYFNHSAIPDFVMTWSGERTQREVFLRHSYESVDAAEDERYLAGADAMLMSLRTARQQRAHAPDAGVTRSRLLLTDAAAVDVIGTIDAPSDRPLTSLVRANFLRGAKGRVDPARAEQLIQLDSPVGTVDSEAAQTLIAKSFAEDAATRINRTAALIAVALDQSDPTPPASGRLSLAELRSLLPWLLRQDRIRSNEVFWRYLGTMFAFDNLEEIRHDLQSLNLSPLIEANASAWTAKRAYVGLVVPPEDANNQPPDRGWSFENAALGFEVAGRRLYLANRGTLLKRRTGNRLPDWAAIQQGLNEKRIASIRLRGIRRSVTLHAEESPDIRADVEDVARSLDDAYVVERVTMRVLAVGEEEGTTDVEVRFDEGIVTADRGASITDLAFAALQVLEFNDPAPSAVVNEALGRPVG